MIKYYSDAITNCGAFIATANTSLNLPLVDLLIDVYHKWDKRVLGLVIGTKEELDAIERKAATETVQYERMSPFALYIFADKIDPTDCEEW